MESPLAQKCKTQFLRTLGGVLDLLITGGTIVDGTGSPPRTGDLGVNDGRIVAVDEVDEPTRRVLDADGLVVAPGFVDLHTHYDAQVLWDGAASPSPLHGVTTVVGGNCGFSVAPLTDDADVDYVRRLMSVVEGIPLSALEQGGDVGLAARSASTSPASTTTWCVNAGFLAGHSTIRRAVMGVDATEGEATVDQVAGMAALLSDSLADGALGFSSGWDNAHYDGDGKAVPSRGARPEEFLALAARRGQAPGHDHRHVPVDGRAPRDRMELMADMSVAADRPVNWNLLGSMSPVEIYEQQLEACDLARDRAAASSRWRCPTSCACAGPTLLATIPEFDEVLRAPEWERRAAVQDPDVRARLAAAIERAAEAEFAAVGRWDLLEIAEPRSPETEPLVGLSIEQAAGAARDDADRRAARRRGAEQLPLTVMLPTLVPSLGATDAGWRARAAIWGDSRVMLGGSDAGAHLDLMCHANYPTMVLGDVGARPPSPPDRGSGAPDDRRTGAAARAARPGPHRRGRARRPRGVRPDTRRVRARDRRATTFRVAANASTPSRSASRHVFVGGTEIVHRRRPHGERGGTALRSGRDTDTVTVRS